MGTTVFQQQNGPLDRYKFGFGEPVPPGLELVRDLDIPRQKQDYNTKLI